jgi:hypothetical protein
MNRHRIASLGAVGALALTAASASAQTAPAQASSTEGALSRLGPPTSITRTTVAEYRESTGAEKRPTAYRPPNPYLMGTGAILVAGPYIAGAIVAGTNAHEWDDKLYYPVLGPWFDLGGRPCTFGSSCSNADHWSGVALIGSGVAQGAGIVLMISSVLVPPPHHKTAVSAKNQRPHVSFMPVSYKGGAGVGAVGTF